MKLYSSKALSTTCRWLTSSICVRTYVCIHLSSIRVCGALRITYMYNKWDSWVFYHLWWDTYLHMHADKPVHAHMCEVAFEPHTHNTHTHNTHTQHTQHTHTIHTHTTHTHTQHTHNTHTQHTHIHTHIHTYIHIYTQNTHMWLSLLKPSLMTHLVFWGIPFWNIEATVVLLCWPHQIYSKDSVVI